MNYIILWLAWTIRLYKETVNSLTALISHLSITSQRHGVQCGRNHIRCQRADQRAETYSTEVSSDTAPVAFINAAATWSSNRRNMQILWCAFVCRYLLQYQEPVPCEQLVTALCDIKQAYTQFGGTHVAVALFCICLMCFLHHICNYYWCMILDK